MVNTTDMTPDTMRELAFTEEDLKELERAETTPERAIKFKRVNPLRHKAN